MEKFEKILPGIYLLKVPFSTIWTGVFLVDGNEKILIDSGASAQSVDECIIPALEEMGLSLSDIACLINTHSHGDHMGGNDRILELAPTISLAAFDGAVDKVSNPLKYSIQTRATYPEFSPKPPAAFPGHVPDLVLKAGDVLGGRLLVVHTPGHDTECISLFDTQTKTLLTGDSIQAFGMTGPDGAGLAFYKDLPAYCNSIRTVELLGPENLIASHDFRPFGCAVFGKDQVDTYLRVCKIATEIYDMLARKKMAAGITELDQLALAVLDELGVEPPPYLFQPMYTLGEHIKGLQKTSA